MKKNYSVKIAGPAGYGIMEAGRILGQALTSLGFQVLVYPEYPSRIRGGDNVVFVSFSFFGSVLPEKKADLVVALTKESFLLHQQEIKKRGVLITDQLVDIKKEKVLSLPLTRVALKHTGREIARNTVSLGVIFGLLGLPLGFLEKEIAFNLSSKGKKVVDGNLAAVKSGYQLTRKSTFLRKILKEPVKESKNFLFSGNDALSLGSIDAGCSYAAIYPMTPINSILADLAKKQNKTGMIVFRPEDEIAGINSAIGASFAGKRSLVATSGGGFSLMIEGFAMAGATETPLVVIEGMRAGPSTGMATWTSQEDLLFLIRAGNGEFPRIIFTPGDPEEAYRLIFAAFNLADVYQLPVIVVTDKHLSESAFATPALNRKAFGLKIDRGKLLNQTPPKGYKRYQITPEGISPRALPGQTVFLTNSYIHDEDGFSIEDGAKRLIMKKKLLKKLAGLNRRNQGTALYGDKEAQLTLVGWGSTKQALLSTYQSLKDKGRLINCLHFFRPWPFPSEAKKFLAKAKKIIVVENNSTGQLASLIQSETGIKTMGKILKDDGRPFFAQEIEKELIRFF
ncbi:MAG: 2-oxoacid:acceptor oxidoreductase subunit alpha [Candidatus Shapirobacteria bacterium]|nr:2-oxoacid:acceptor oxidoreductase subunit alpha [Candidatus Shapirobacteria bacterium]